MSLDRNRSDRIQRRFVSFELSLFSVSQCFHFRLPPIHFSPVSIENQEGKIEKLQCDLYRGSMCRIILNSKYVSVTNVKHKDIEENLFNHMKILSEECRRFLLPMVCLFIYPICDDERVHLRSVCRQSCYFYQNHPCARGITVDQTPDTLLNCKWTE